MRLASDRAMVISLTVVTDDQNHASRAAEAMARVATGLVLDGIDVNLSMGVPDDEDEDESA